MLASLVRKEGVNTPVLVTGVGATVSAVCAVSVLRQARESSSTMG